MPFLCPDCYALQGLTLEQFRVHSFSITTVNDFISSPRCRSNTHMNATDSLMSSQHRMPCICETSISLPAALRTDSMSHAVRSLQSSRNDGAASNLMTWILSHRLGFCHTACNVGGLHNVAWTCKPLPKARAPAEDLVILPNLLLHHKFTDGLEGNSHCLGLVLDV